MKFPIDNLYTWLYSGGALPLGYCGKDDVMQETISYQFNKHYKRMLEDLRQVQGFTHAMEKLLSFNMTKLENDVLNEVNKHEQEVKMF